MQSTQRQNQYVNMDKQIPRESIINEKLLSINEERFNNFRLQQNNKQSIHDFDSYVVRGEVFQPKQGPDYDITKVNFNIVQHRIPAGNVSFDKLNKMSKTIYDNCESKPMSRLDYPNKEAGLQKILPKNIPYLDMKKQSQRKYEVFYSNQQSPRSHASITQNLNESRNIPNVSARSQNQFKSELQVQSQTMNLLQHSKDL